MSKNWAPRMVIFKGETINLGVLAAREGIPYRRLASRLKRGWPVERAVLEPIAAFGPSFVDRTGQTFSRLLVLRPVGRAAVSRNIVWECLCDCGTMTKVASDHLVSGNTMSCGCLAREAIGDRARTHAQSKRGAPHYRAYNSWSGMRQRCLQDTHRVYHLYGGRGISICQQWVDSFEAFLNDMGDPPAGYSLDRIDVNGNYEPENCRWATQKTQSRNKQNTVMVDYAGRPIALRQLAEELGLPFSLLLGRIKRGWSVDRAVTR